MSDGDRGYRLAALGALIAFGLTCFGCGLYLASLPKPEYQRGASSSASSNPSDSPQPAPQISGTTPSPAGDLQPSPAEQTSYAREDLKAQRVMAWWTRIMGVAAAIGIVLGGVSIWLIWRTWDATREAAESSRKTLSSYIWKERGYAEAAGAFYIDVGPQPFRPGVLLNVENVGLSPLKIMSVSFGLVQEKAWNPVRLSIQTKRVLVPADETRESGILILPEISEGWLVGRIDYTTLNDEEFTSYFCFDIEWVDMGGMGANHWGLTQIQPPAMPSNT